MLISGFVFVKWVFVLWFLVPPWKFGESDSCAMSVLVACSSSVLTGNAYWRWMLANWDELGGNVKGESLCGPLKMGSVRQ